MQSRTFTTILFDLDGTLLPLDQQAFMHQYFNLFGRYCHFLGYNVDQALKGLEAGLGAMFASDGTSTNKERFDRHFAAVSGIDSDEFNVRFAPFYDETFNQIKETSSATSLSRTIVEELGAKGYELVLATAPLFPWQATHARLKWAGLEPEMFTVITTYEHCHYTKPALEYYQNLLKEIGRQPQECLMVGNDVQEDLVVSSLGMEAYLVTDCLINRDSTPVESFAQGSLAEFYQYAKERL